MQNLDIDFFQWDYIVILRWVKMYGCAFNVQKFNNSAPFIHIAINSIFPGSQNAQDLQKINFYCTHQLISKLLNF